jgi:hypothetical protein
MPSAGIEPVIPAIEWPQAYALDRITSGIGLIYTVMKIHFLFHK